MGELAKGGTRKAAPHPAVYYVSDRPEAYEMWAEVSHEEAALIGRAIAEHAHRDFPEIDFRVDHEWHVHQDGLAHVAAHIDAHLQSWVDEALGR